MSDPVRAVDLDPVPAAALFAAIAGGLSVPYAYFDGLTAALAALLALACAIERRGSRRRWAGPIPAGAIVWAIAIAGWVAFLGDPPALRAVRGLLLGVTGVPLWLGLSAPPRPSEPESPS